MQILRAKKGVWFAPETSRYLHRLTALCGLWISHRSTADWLTPAVVMDTFIAAMMAEILGISCGESSAKFRPCCLYLNSTALSIQNVNT